jgi:Glycosyl transferase family 11
MDSLHCTIHMVGGLGNQMFQYALGRRLEIERRAHIRYDLAQYKVAGERDLNILKFRTRLPEPSRLDDVLFRLSLGRSLRLCRPFVKMLGPSVQCRYYEDKRQGYDPKVLKLTGRWYLHGWWQSHAILDPIQSMLREEFQLVAPLSGHDLEIQRRIDDVNAVSVHVRRGDLITHPIYSKTIKVQTPDYFKTSMRKIADQVGDPHFFVFSDDPDWCKEHVRIDAPITYMDHNDGRRDYVDLVLMSHCRHFITANSSFSWWGAWLSRNAEKIVIVPSVWGTDGSGPIPDLIPSGWQIEAEPTILLDDSAPRSTAAAREIRDKACSLA